MPGERGLLLVVLAAGLGKRMRSETPKVLHRVCGRPMVSYVVDAAGALSPDQTVIVVGHGAEEVKAALEGKELDFVIQEAQRGTGDAVRVALEGRDEFHEVVVVPGDSPLIKGETLRSLLEKRRADDAAACLLVTEMEDPTGYGRVIRDGSGRIVDIVEETDCSQDQRSISEVNACTYAFDGDSISSVIGDIGCDNAQGEYYLVDVVSMFTGAGEKVISFECSPEEARGVNDREQLSYAQRVMRDRINEELMLSGVTLIDPETTYVDWGVEVAKDVTLMPSVMIAGDSGIERGAVVGPHVSVEDSRIGEDARVRFAVLEGCEVGDRAEVGPFSRVRPGTRVGEGGKVGTFVEVKNSTIGRGSKVPHLSYIGDAEIGEGVNVGAGSITCNYDGKEKHATVIDDGAFLGSDTMMVAPVRIGKKATTGAGSVIYDDVPDGALGIERTEQKNVPEYRERHKEGTEE